MNALAFWTSCSGALPAYNCLLATTPALFSLTMSKVWPLSLLYLLYVFLVSGDCLAVAHLFLEIHSRQGQRNEHISQLFESRQLLTKEEGHFRYLGHLLSADAAATECPICYVRLGRERLKCTEGASGLLARVLSFMMLYFYGLTQECLGESYSVLTCGHLVCLSCTEVLAKRGGPRWVVEPGAGVVSRSIRFSHDRRELHLRTCTLFLFSIKCPVCKQTTPLGSLMKIHPASTSQVRYLLCNRH